MLERFGILKHVFDLYQPFLGVVLANSFVTREHTPAAPQVILRVDVKVIDRRLRLLLVVLRRHTHRNPLRISLDQIRHLTVDELTHRIVVLVVEHRGPALGGQELATRFQVINID